MKIGGLFKSWCVSLIVTLGVIIGSIRWLDLPIAEIFFGGSNRVVGFGQALSSSNVVAGDAALMVSLGVIRVACGSLPNYAKAVFVACLASLAGFAANDYILKSIFGRNGPYIFLSNPTMESFNFFHGNQYSVFPSGHMVISATFAAALVRMYPSTWPIFTGLLGVGSLGLLIGDWHFLSDIIAGTFIGVTVGLIAGELWSLHIRRRD